MACLYELQEIFKEVSGMHAVSLAPAAGAQGEFAGVAMIRAYHRARGDTARNEILIPDAGHGSNPASAVMCGYRVKEIPTGDDGDLNLAVLRNALGPRTAGIMLTNPSTLGLFDRNIREIAAGVHDAGGRLYYDGGNLNAILEELDGFVAALIKIRAEAREQPDLVRSAPTGCRCAACTRYEPPSAWIWRGPPAMANGNTTLPAGVVLSGPAAFPCRVTSVRDIN